MEHFTTYQNNFAPTSQRSAEPNANPSQNGSMYCGSPLNPGVPPDGCALTTYTTPRGANGFGKMFGEDPCPYSFVEPHYIPECRNPTAIPPSRLFPVSNPIVNNRNGMETMYTRYRPYGGMSDWRPPYQFPYQVPSYLMASQITMPWGRSYVQRGVKITPLEDVPVNSLAFQRINSKAFTVAVDDMAKSKVSRPWAVPGSPDYGLEYPWNESDYAMPSIYPSQ